MGMSDALFEYKDVSFYPEPGAVPDSAVSAVSSPSIKQSYRTMTNNLKTSFDQFNLRDCLLSSCQELNRGEFFVLLQVSLLVFFPSLGLSIIAQSCDVDDADANQQQFTIDDADVDDQDLIDYTRIRSMFYQQQTQTQKRIRTVRKATQQKNSTPENAVNAHGSEDIDSAEAMRGIENGENGEGRGYGALKVTTKVKVMRTVVIRF